MPFIFSSTCSLLTGLACPGWARPSSANENKSLINLSVSECQQLQSHTSMNASSRIWQSTCNQQWEWCIPALRIIPNPGDFHSQDVTVIHNNLAFNFSTHTRNPTTNSSHIQFINHPQIEPYTYYTYKLSRKSIRTPSHLRRT